MEVASIHGASEALDGPGLIYSPVPGHAARDALDLGFLLGFAGGGDTHDGHPGLGWITAGRGGLLAVLDAENRRPALLEALRSRRVYATNGPRILLFASLDGHPMGSVLPPAASRRLVVFTVGQAPLATAEVVRRGQVVERFPGQGQPLLQVSVDLEDLSSGEYLYVRVAQEDGGVAWSSPFFVAPEPATMPAPARSPP